MSVDIDDARMLDSWVYDCLLADMPRALNRARINSSANGAPPYTDEEAEENHINVNVSDLSMPRLLHDARSQFSNGFMGQMGYFTCKTDSGPIHKRSVHGGVVTKESNQLLKESIDYFEAQRSSFASLTLHGIAPGVWENEERVIPRPIGVEDLLVPTDTLLSFQNLPFFALRRSFTAMELMKATSSTYRDKGWNEPFVKRCIEWAESSMTQLSNNNWPTPWSPEKWEERAKESAGWYMSDAVPTIDCFDVYFYEGDGKKTGWKRRVILDSWSNPGVDPKSGKVTKPERKRDRLDKDKKSLDDFAKDDFLFSSENRIVASSWQNIIACQFADLSAVAPFRYHSVRSLGWMLYAVCHLRNRMYCRTQEAVFEALLQYFEVDSMDDVQRALKLNLANMGVIDKTIRPVKAGDRWQPNAGLIELGLGMTQQVMDQNAKSWTANPTQQQKKERETNFQRMADLQAINALVSAGINQAYQYKAFEYREIVRRMMIKGSRDPMAQRFQSRCIAQGVPESLLYSPEKWDVQSERMMGGGNQTIEQMVADSLMQQIQGFEPEPQRIIRRDYVMALTKSPSKALELVPESPVKVTSATHDAELAAGALLQGIPVEPLTGVNMVEFTVQMLKILAQRVQNGMKQGGMVSPQELKGLQAMAQNVQQHIQILSKDENNKALVKKLGDVLGKLVNEIKAFAQRLQQAAKAQQAKQQQQNGQDPKAMAKVQEMKMTGAAKREEQSRKASQKRSEDEVAFEQRIHHETIQHHADLASKDLETAANIRRGMFEEDESNDQDTGGGDDGGRN